MLRCEDTFAVILGFRDPKFPPIILCPSSSNSSSSSPAASLAAFSVKMQRTTAISRFHESIQRGSNSTYSDVIHFARKVEEGGGLINVS